jgi:IS1 family transposase
LWQALDHRTGTVLAYVFGRREGGVLNLEVDLYTARPNS